MKYGVSIHMSMVSILLLAIVMFVGSVGVAGQGPAGAAVHWAFEETGQWAGAEGEVKDSIDGAHGSAKGGAERVSNQEGRPGSIASFDGVNDYILVPNRAELLPATDALTVAGWLKINCAEGSCKNDITGTMVSRRESYILSPNADRSVCFWINIGGGPGWQNVCTLAGVLKTGTWQHVAGVYDGKANILSIYVDDTLKNSVSVSGNIQTSSEPLCMGKDYCSGGTIQNRYLEGAVDDVFIYGRALSADEIRVLRQPPVAAGACAAGDTKPIFALSSESNAHVFPGSSTIANAYKICFGKAFPNTAFPGDADVYACKGDAAAPSNTVLYVSNKAGNAHAAVLGKTPPAGYEALCYGEMSCSVRKIADGACLGGTTLIAALSAESNAHVASSASAAYPYQICCNPKAGPEILSVEWHYEAADTSEGSMLADNKVLATIESPLPFTPDSTNIRIIVKTTMVDEATLKNIKITLREVDKNSEVPKDSTADDSDDDLGVMFGTPTVKVDAVSKVGKAVFSWKMENKKPGIGNAYASTGNDEKTIEDMFEFKAWATPATGSLLIANESNILYAQTGKWECSSEKTSAQRFFNGKPQFTLTESTRATDKRLAGEACKGPDEKTGTGTGLSSTSRDDCCPTNMKCTLQGCIPVGIIQCQDYSLAGECNADPANLWRNKPGFVNPERCKETNYLKACEWVNKKTLEENKAEWDSLSSKLQNQITKQEGLCKYVVKQNSSTEISATKAGTIIAQCLYLYDDQGECEADNYRPVNVIATKDRFDKVSGYDCQIAEKKCIGGPQRIPCGQPAFQLPFFGALQAAGAVAAIVMLYLVMFHSKAMRKWIVKKGAR